MMWQRYVAIGDSTTEGLDDPDGHGGYRGWADRFAAAVARAQGGLEYANLAIRGRTTAKILAEQLPVALDLAPDLCTVVAGMNDVLRPSFDAERIAADVATMQRALAGQGATVLTFTLPDPVPVMPLARPLRGRMFALNAALRRVTAQTGASLVDFAAHPVASDPRLWSEDRLHANSAGHERIAAALAYTAGLPGYDDSWTRPLEEAPRRRRHEMVRAELTWARRHLLPWVARHARGRSSGDQRVAKRPVPLPVELD
ncbi:SGNH/GDSL hydrolase family protein [Micromonospora sp. CPCC 205711]|uniref:SGNH/GDSL hydrolase family protein n=1 Tax=Micromonospora sp. CPCC 205547 TaxID=3122400 RepID=UPI002FF2A8E5